jgi:hypothetical protein
METAFTLENLFTYDLTVPSILLRLVAATVLSSIISLIFNSMNRSKAGNYLMMHTLIFLAVAIAGAMMIIGNNLARAFGLVGAVSIIRFRSAVKVSRDMAFVLFVIVLGMACGLGYLPLAAILMVFGSFLMLLFWKTRFGQVRSRNLEFELKISHICETCSRIDVELVLDEIVITWSFTGMKEDRNVRTLTYQFIVDDYAKVEVISDRLRGMGKQDEIGVRIRSS